MTDIEPIDFVNTVAILRGYLMSAVWASLGDDPEDQERSAPLDDLGFSMDDIDPEACVKASRDVLRFLRLLSSGALYLLGDEDQERVGHDLWLTRNGHGAGFWDGDYDHPKEYATELTEAAEKLGEVDLYVGDDSLLHFGGE